MIWVLCTSLVTTRSPTLSMPMDVPRTLTRPMSTLRLVCSCSRVNCQALASKVMPRHLSRRMSTLRPIRHPVWVLPQLLNGVLLLRSAQLPRLPLRLDRSQIGTVVSMTSSRSRRFLQPTALSRAMPSALLALLRRPALVKSLVGPSLIPAVVLLLGRPRWVDLVPTRPPTPCPSWEMRRPLVMNVLPVVASAEGDLSPLLLVAPPPPPLLVPTAARLAVALLLTTVLSLLLLRFGPSAMSDLLLPARHTPTNSITTALARLLQVVTPLASLRAPLHPPRRLQRLRPLLVSVVRTAQPLR